MGKRFASLALVFTLAFAVAGAQEARAFGNFLKKAKDKVKKEVDKEVDKAIKDVTGEAPDESGDKPGTGGTRGPSIKAPDKVTVPILLDKWQRHHTNITTYERPAKKPGGGTDYTKIGWVPKVNLVIQLTDPEDDDIIILQHFKGAEPWGDPMKCKPTNVTKRDGKNYSLVRLDQAKMDDDLRISEAGEFAVKVSYRQTALGKTHEIGTFSYTVKPYTKAWTSKGKTVGYTVDHDFRMGEAWLYRLSDGKIQIWTWFKYDRKSEANVRDGRMRCTHESGKSMKFFDNPTARQANSYQEYREKTKNTQVTWGLWYWWIPRIDNKPAAEWFRKSPGKYTCVLTQAGEIARTFTFTVGPDGEFVRRPFPGMKTIYAVEDEVPLTMEFKNPPDLPFDKTRFAKAKLYGRK